jgi:hypothetical protein
MTIDLADAITTTERLLEELRGLNGTEPDAAPTRAARRQRTEINRNFLLLAHRADLARIQVMDAYYDYKEWDWGDDTESKND